MTTVQERVESILAAPPAGATGLLILGYSLSDVVLWLNFVYITILIVHKLYKLGQEGKEGGSSGCAN